MRVNAPNKEAVYDELIEPLMDRIMRICYANGIAMVAQFHVPSDKDPDIMCNSQLTDADDKVPWQLQRAWLNADNVTPVEGCAKPGWAGEDPAEHFSAGPS